MTQKILDLFCLLWGEHSPFLHTGWNSDFFQVNDKIFPRSCLDWKKNILGPKKPFFEEHFSGASVSCRIFLSLDIIFLSMHIIQGHLYCWNNNEIKSKNNQPQTKPRNTPQPFSVVRVHVMHKVLCWSSALCLNLLSEHFRLVYDLLVPPDALSFPISSLQLMWKLRLSSAKHSSSLYQFCPLQILDIISHASKNCETL